MSSNNSAISKEFPVGDATYSNGVDPKSSSHKKSHKRKKKSSDSKVKDKKKKKEKVSAFLRYSFIPIFTKLKG